MNKTTFLVSAFVVSLGVIGGTAAPAHAQEAATCDSIVISNTGAGSNNEGTCIINVSVNAVCENNIYVLNDNSQEAVSGAASTIGVVNGETTVSGNATNENNATVELGASCGEATPETPVTPVTPTPGNGTNTPTTPTPGMGSSTPKQPIAALPNTAANSAVVAIAGVVAAITAAFAASRLAMYTYRRANEK